MGKKLNQIDENLLQEARKGNQQAISQLILKYENKIRKIVYSYLQQYADTQDLTQEIFFKAFSELDNFREESQFYTWLYRIAINTVKNNLSKKVKQPDNTSYENLPMTLIPTETANPMSELECEILKKQLADKVEHLPETLKQVFLLREIAELSYADIARTLECPIGTVRSRLQRVRKYLQTNNT